MWREKSDNFAKFPDYIKRFKDADPCNFAALDITATREFQATFFCPGGLRAAGPCIRHFTAVDGTYTKSRYQMMLLIACGINANDQVILLAWALVPIKEASWWNWFLRYLKACYPEIDVENYTFISNREKGIAQAIPEQFEHSIHLYCCQHIADNIQQRFRNKVRPLFWQAVRAKTRDLFKSKIEEIQVQSKPVFDYLMVIKKSLCTTLYRVYPRYGHDTSNIIELVNSSWDKIR
jgi:transposase-like protein